MGPNYKGLHGAMCGDLHLYPYRADPFSLMPKIKSIKCKKKEKIRDKESCCLRFKFLGVNNSDFR